MNLQMYPLSSIDKYLLEELQNDFPLVSKPYKIIAEKLNISEETLIEKTKNLCSEKIIRNISAIINAGKIGFQSTLVAVRVNENQIDNVAQRINTHPGVSHNYLRNHTYNIWFTLTIKKDKDLVKEVGDLLDFSGKEVIDYLILPSVRTFKIGVNFRFSQKKYDHDKNETIDDKGEIELSSTDKEIINKVQDNMDIISEPWKKIASSLNISEGLLFERIQYLKKSGAIRRISATINHRKVGILFNAMCCFKVSEEQIISAGIKISEHPQLTHCYQRKIFPCKWDYPLFAMVHAESENECEIISQSLSQQINCNDYIILFSTKELKKERIKYLTD